MEFLADLSKIDAQVKSGELNQAGKMAMPLQGEAILFHCEFEARNGKHYICLYLTDSNKRDYRRFDIKVPSAGDSDRARYMGVQNLYSVLFSAMKKDPSTIKIDDCLNDLIKTLKEKSIIGDYVLREYKYLAQTGQNAGKEQTAQSLDSFAGKALIPKVNIEIKKKEQAQSTSSSWDSQSEFVPF